MPVLGRWERFPAHMVLKMNFDTSEGTAPHNTLCSESCKAFVAARHEGHRSGEATRGQIVAGHVQVAFIVFCEFICYQEHTEIKSASLDVLPCQLIPRFTYSPTSANDILSRDHFYSNTKDTETIRSGLRKVW